MKEYPDDESCLWRLWHGRYSSDGEHAYCPKCETERSFKRYATSQQRQSWTCTVCGYHLHPTAGTVFHKSSTSLHLWFYAMYLMTSTRCGISAKQLERELGVTYKTAWRIAKEIRKVLMEQDDTALEGTIEADEMYVGGRRRGTQRGRPSKESHKVPVFGMASREGQVRAMTVPNVRRATVMPHIRKYALPSATIYTDEFAVYNRLAQQGYGHKRVNHGEQVYVSGDVHTNT